LERIEQRELNIQPFEIINVCGDRRKDTGKPKLLLHSCCGPCSTVALERLSDAYSIYLLFYNPNITEEGEYIRRKNTQERFIFDFNERIKTLNRVTYIEGLYEPEIFLETVKGLEEEPEGGARCSLCFKMRLEKAAEMTVLKDCEYFSTTLSVSPHKDFELIQKIGVDIGMRYKISFLAVDLKKQGGYQKSIEMSKTYDLYRQNYCGCRFSAK